MSVAFVVLAHRCPAQVARLARRLAPYPVLLHVSGGVHPSVSAAFEAETARLEHVEALPRHRSNWGSWGIVAASLTGLRGALALPEDWTHVALLSGQDYPLSPVAEIDAFLAGHAGRSFVPRWGLPTPLWGRDGGMHRVRYRHWPVRGRRLFLPVPRRPPKGIALHGGSLWWVLSRPAAEAVARFVEARPDVTRFYERTWIPDEMFVPTALMNGPEAERVINESLTFIRWSRRGAPHPDVLGASDEHELAAAARGASSAGGYGRRKLFARKFDAEIDAEILDRMDARAMAAR